MVHRVTTSGTTNDNEWPRMVERVTRSDNKWQQVTTNDNNWQQQEASGKTNEKGKVHFKEWMTAILSVTKSDILATSRDGWLQLECLNK